MKPDAATTAESKVRIGVNYPHKWANSIDEEDEQVSSWEIEPEGELASLETLDDEGEWCWPRRNRITRWSRKVDPRPAFHYLAEDDEGEQAAGRTESPGRTKCWGRSMDAEESHSGG